MCACRERRLGSVDCADDREEAVVFEDLDGDVVSWSDQGCAVGITYAGDYNCIGVWMRDVISR
jgi:hypothetical protein